MGSDPPLDQEEFRRWREDADAALASARLQTPGGPYNWACFAAEQAAQLAIKALLHGLGQAPWGHDLDRLRQLTEAAGVDLGDETAHRLRRLGRHYIPSRYADNHASGAASEHYDERDAVEAVADAEAILAFVDRAWAEAEAS